MITYLASIFFFIIAACTMCSRIWLIQNMIIGMSFLNSVPCNLLLNGMSIDKQFVLLAYNNV